MVDIEQKMEWRVREPGRKWELPRRDQDEAIKNYMQTQVNLREKIRYHSGIGYFDVTFGDIITSYKKDNGDKVEVMFGNKNEFVRYNRQMDGLFGEKKSKKRSIRLKSLKNIKNRSSKKRSK